MSRALRLRVTRPAGAACLALLAIAGCGPRPAGIADAGPRPTEAADTTGAAVPSAAAAPTPSALPTNVAEVRLDVDPPRPRVGDTARVVVSALDARGNTVPGVSFRIRAPRRLLGVIEDGMALVAVREGSGTVTAEAQRDAAPIPGVSRGAVNVTVRPAPLTALSVVAPGRMYAGERARVESRARTDFGGREREPVATWTSSDPAVLRVSPRGHLEALTSGTARIVGSVEGVTGAAEVVVVPNPVRRLVVRPLEADVQVGDVVHLSARALDAEGREVEDAAIRWSVGGEPAATADALVAKDGAFVANTAGTYRAVATFGELAATTFVQARPRPPREPIELIGRHPAPSGAGATTDLWVFEGVDGRDYAYTGTLAAARLYVWDVTDPGAPVLTDSARLDGRRVNDVKINAAATIAVVTSEGAANRRNGITLFDILDPAHPRPITHFTENLTGGVHNVWIEGDLVYAVHNGTRDLHVVDISDPAAPRHVGRWGIESEGRSLHDVMVKDGLAYLSYWNDGLVILDVGAGIAGGTPTEPSFVSRHVYSYPLGAESYGNTHHAIRYRNWVFVADEIFGCSECVNGPRGYVHVIDVADIRNPVEVAFYRVPEAGAHNLWVEDDRMYVAYYQAGVRVVDISGELRGDLWKQGREIGWFMTETPTGDIPNATMAWGPQPYKGHLFVSDLNTGLWVLRLARDAREPIP